MRSKISDDYSPGGGRAHVPEKTDDHMTDEKRATFSRVTSVIDQVPTVSQSVALFWSSSLQSTMATDKPTK
jgi:hypothetical protein